MIAAFEFGVATIALVKKAVRHIEGFDLIVFDGDGNALGNTVGGLHDYSISYSRAAGQKITVERWAHTRFLKHYPNLSVAVLDGHREAVGLDVTLGEVRHSYIDHMPEHLRLLREYGPLSAGLLLGWAREALKRS